MNKLDRKGKRARWTLARVAERNYASRLLQVARQVAMIVKGPSPDGAGPAVPTIASTLRAYAELIEPWARATAAFMIADVDRRDRAMWRRNSADISAGVRRELQQAPTGAAMRQLQDEQVALIKSLPLQAAERVHELAEATLVSGQRASTLVDEVHALGGITESRARLIARTEVSRAGSNLLQARSQYAGSDGYVWRTSQDADVRDSHAEMEGKYVRWAAPPTLDGLKGHAGCFPNCRCYAEPVFPDD